MFKAQVASAFFVIWIVMHSLAFSMRRPLPWRLSSSLVLRSSHREYVLVKNSPRLTSARARSFATVPTSGWRLTARRCRKVLLFLIPHLIGAHPLTVELVGDTLDGDLHFRYLGVVKGLSVASEGLLRGDILEEHQDALHAAGGGGHV